MTRFVLRMRSARAWLVVAALGATAPAVRWCPLDWDQLAPGAYLECAAAAGVGSPACALSFPPGADVRACVGCPHDRPASAGSSGGACEACPLAHPATPARRAHAPASHESGRAYLLGDAAYARAVRGESPRVNTPPALAGLFASAVATAPAPARGTPLPRAKTLPPAARPGAPPPARAPPHEA